MINHQALLAIKSEQSLSLNGHGQWAEGIRYFIQLYEGFLSSGLLTELHGTEIKILLSLGLQSSPLGIARNGTPSQAVQAEKFFQDLVAKGIARKEDRGRLFCYIEHNELASLVGVSKNTLTKHANRLCQRGLIERRSIRRGSYGYIIYFIEPTAFIDKYNTLYPCQPSSSPPSPVSVPNLGMETSVPSKNQIGTNLIDPATATTTTAAAAVNFDDQIVLDHFAARKGVTLYRPTAHDRAALQRLHHAGVSQAQVIAAIDQAFDIHDSDAPPIRMFSYCAKALLRQISEPPHQVSAPQASPAAPPQPLSSSPGETVSATVENVVALYQAEIGPVTPVVEVELRSLLQRHPLLQEWRFAFREAVVNNIRKLSYVESILKRLSHQRSDRPPTTRRNQHERKRAPSTSRRYGGAQDHRIQPAFSTQDIKALRERARQVEPLSIEEVLGTADA